MDRRSRILDHNYDPARIEPPWVEAWEDARAFATDPAAGGDPYCVILPPPNVTGALHMGHALNDTLQDILVRFHRMDGRNVLWQPGTDHAGIATQTVVERKLRAEGRERVEIGREAFLEAVWEWKETSGNRIVSQLKRLGASCDWERLRFTMDDHSSRAVREAFVRLYEEGLIYRGEYLVNWDPVSLTALSDLEVEPEEIDGGLYELIYPVTGSDVRLVVATTRPETMLGDTGVAVHPGDDRYAHLVGKTVTLPLVGREIPIVGDEHVDMEYGTGVLKVTPAHDFNDFEIGHRHGLEAITILDEHARIVDGYAPYSGLDRYDARKRIMQDLKEQGLAGKTESIRHTVGHSYRSHVAVEPRLSEQWFVKAGPLAEAVLARVDAGETRILPEQWDKVLHHWLEDIRDWCISRQLWWGHRIPVWTCAGCGHVDAYREDPDACPECGGSDLQQDPDVLDTWFSSGLWPMSTLGWPADDPALATWYPTATLVTAADILFFWVARMMMFGIHFTGKVPFADVVLHAIVRDEDGEKMSKTKGNVVDPLDVIEDHGADALRFTLASMTALGRDIRLDPKRIEGYRHFGNKLWNACRLVLRTVPAEIEPDTAPKHPLNRWILAEIDACSSRMRRALDAYHYADFCQEVYHLAWSVFCDWYLEGTKVLVQAFPEHEAETHATLVVALERILRLLHPAMPFVTEELAAALPLDDARPVALRPFPTPHPDRDAPDATAAMAEVMDCVHAVRNIRGENGLSPKQALDVRIAAGDGCPILEPAWRPLVEALARIGELTPTTAAEAPRFSGTHIGHTYQIWVPLEGLVDVDSEIERLEKALADASEDQQRADRKLANPNFVERAPAEVVEEERRKLAEAEDVLARTEPHLAMLRAYKTEQNT